jgi:hypothetical protein
MQLKSKDLHNMFSQQRRTKGSVALNHLLEDHSSISSDKTLRISNSLSSVNQQIQRRLHQLMNEGRIIGIKFKNCFFNIKLNINSDFISIPSIEFLDELLDMEITTY